MILVVGSTGLLGSEIVRQCGGKVRALARPSAAKEKLDGLRAAGAEIVWGDLKDAASLEAACAGVDAVISTASSTLSRQAGDDLESVDRRGQLALVEAARRAGVRHFTFFGIGPQYGDSPLVSAKQDFERAVKSSGMAWTNFEGNFFMEVWLSPALGFDYSNGKAVLFGGGEGANSWVSYRDLAVASSRAAAVKEAWNRDFSACGPEALSQREAVTIFERATGRTFECAVVPMEALREASANAADPLQKTFAELQLACGRGVRMDPAEFAGTFDLKLRSVAEWAGECC